MPLALLVPDLIPPSDAPAALRSMRLPALEKWFARADRGRQPGRGPMGALAQFYGLREPLPVAALSLAGEGGPSEGAWLRADPVHLRVDHDYLRLHDASTLDVTPDEAAVLVASLQAHFASDRLEFRAVAPERWYVRVPEGDSPKTTPLADAIGRDIFGLLPEAGGRINWRSAITEAQMLMGGHEVNARREAAGKPAINSVWFWGEGAAPASIDRRFTRVYAADALARGLGALSGAQVRAPVASLADVEAVEGNDTALVVLDVLTAPLSRGDPAAWGEAAARLDADWFALLGEAIKRFGEVRLVLPAEKETLVATLTPAARWRWLRARRPLAHA